MNPDGIWRKAQQSGFEGNCVEICRGHVQVGIRNSRDPGPRLVLAYPEYRAFIGWVNSGEILEARDGAAAG